jgi:hypothetical protein
VSTTRDVSRIVRSWLEDGVTQLPDRVLDAVLDQLPTTPQRRAGWLARRFPIMNSTTVRYGIAAVVVVIAALFGYQYLSRNVGGPGPIATPTPTVQPTPTAEPTPAFSALGTQETLAGGRYVVGSLPFDVTVDVPAGWGSSGDWVAVGPRGNDPPDGMAVRFYSIDNLAANPLSSDEGVVEPPVGPAVDDLVQAIVSHPDWTASAPTDITIDGRPGQLVTITIPSDVELGTDGRFYLSLDPGGGGIWGFAPDQAFDWYIVDVDGHRLVIDAFHYPGTSEEDLAAQRTVVDSVEFE